MGKISAAFRLVLSALLLQVTIAFGAEFTQKDLERMVRELDAFAPKHPDYLYPIKAKLVEEDEVNAYATLEKPEAGKKPQTLMVVFTGLVKEMKGDARLIRAVVAHEIAHLSKGHVSGPSFIPGDLANLYTRQQEFEADATGAAFLQRAGHSKQDMVDMLMFLDKLEGRGPGWLGKLSGDHAAAVARASEVADNPLVLRSLLSFDLGLAFMECRSFAHAARAFDRAIEQQPKFFEAYVNAAQAALMDYYNQLPVGVQNAWFRPDFGPMITQPKFGRAVEIDEKDRKRYNAAMARIAKALEANKEDSRTLEVAALALILDPDGKPDSLKAGMDYLRELLKNAIVPADKLRYANNLAVGLQRSGDLTAATKLLLDTQMTTNVYNAALAENLGSKPIEPSAKERDQTAAAVMHTFLLNSPPAAENWARVEQNYLSFCKKANLQAQEVKRKPVFLCQVASIFVDGVERSMFSPIEDFEKSLGTPDARTIYDEKYPDLMEIRWLGGDFTLLAERGQAMRVTSYRKGAYVLLKPVDESVKTSFRIEVGMNKSDFSKVLDPSKGQAKQLVRGGKLEQWSYYPGLNLGVLMVDDRVAGVTATPVE